MVHVVDDDASVRLALRRVLLAAGLQARAYASREEFLRGGSAPGDCLVVDVGVLRADGPAMPPLPLIVIAGRDVEDMPALSMAGQATAFLAKPLDTGELLAVIARLLAGS